MNDDLEKRGCSGTTRAFRSGGKLQVLLAEAGVALPVSTIHRILLRRGLVRQEDRYPAAVQRFERAAPNQLWQMDFKGSKGWGWETAVGPLSVLDDHSRYLIALRGTWTTKAEAVREQLDRRLVSVEYRKRC